MCSFLTGKGDKTSLEKVYAGSTTQASMKSMKRQGVGGEW